MTLVHSSIAPYVVEKIHDSRALARWSGVETTKQIQGHIAGASGITACEQGLLNSTYHAHGRTQYVTKVRSVRTKTKRIGQIKARAAVQYTITATDGTERCMDKHALMSEMEKGCNISAEAAAALERIKQVRGKPSSDARWIQKAQGARVCRRCTSCATPRVGRREGSLPW